ncbi:MAG: site-2 protease family protein [Anaerolineae bacterium]|nr:site-2 protease family protein [Anaerolineae bacterium]
MKPPRWSTQTLPFPVPTQRRSVFIALGLLLLVALVLLPLSTLIGRLIALALAFSIHEWAHAYAALRLGDRTAYNQGRVTLDPRAHLDVIGFVLALLAGFGWAKPVPVNPRAFYPNEQRGLLIVAFAGPLSNLVLAAVLGVLLRVVEGLVPYGEGGALDFFYQVWATVIIFNLALFCFNLVPLAPLDGWKVLLGVLPSQDSYRLAAYEEQSMRLLLLVLLIGAISPGLSLVGLLLNPPIRFLFELITGLNLA